MPARERDERGRYSGAASDGDFLTAVGANEPATTREVADAVGYTLDGARQRLRALEDAGRVRSKAAGPVTVWMLDVEPGRDTTVNSLGN